MATTSSRQRPTPLTISHLERRPDGSYELGWRCADREAFQRVVSAVKALPLSRRCYDPSRKVWIIQSVALLLTLDAHLPGLRRAVEHLDDAERPGERLGRQWQGAYHAADVQRTVPPPVAAALATLFLAPGAPRQLLQPVYRQLALLAHPDRQGGDTRRMAEINKAYALVRDFYERTSEQRGAA